MDDCDEPLMLFEERSVSEVDSGERRADHELRDAEQYD